MLWGLITYFLRSHEIEEEEFNTTIGRHPDLMSKVVDVTRIKVLHISHGPVLSNLDRQA